MGKSKLKLLLGSLFLLFIVVIAGFAPAWAAQPTVAHPLTDQSAIENLGFNVSFGVNAFQDEDGDTLTYTATQFGGASLPAWLNFDAVTRTFSGTPNNGDVGDVTVEVTASDGTESVSDDFVITVYEIGNAPSSPIVVNPIPNQNTTEDAAFNFQFASDTFESEEETLIYSAQSAGGSALPAWLNFNGATRTFSGTPMNADVGIISIDLTADDGNSGVTTDTFDIVIANVNDAPTLANAIPDQNAIEDTVFSFQFAANTFSDADVGDTLTYSAQLAGGGSLPSWLNFNAATRTFSGTPMNADIGIISVDVTTSDGNGGSLTDTFNIAITNTNDAPTVANPIPSQNATEDTAFNFQFAANTFSDADVGDTLTYSVQLPGGGLLPSWLSFDPATRTFSGTPISGDAGTLTVEITANDGNGGTVTDTFNITVTAASPEITDADGDGSLDTVEQAGPNNGDANNDGTADAEQSNVISYVNPVSANYAVFVTDCESIAGFQVSDESGEYPDADYRYPFGLADFQITCSSSGDTAHIMHYYYGVTGNDSYLVRKWLPDGSYTAIAGAQNLGQLIDGEVVFLVRYSITDGSDYDDDGTENGVVVDPSGAALAESNTPDEDTKTDGTTSNPGNDQLADTGSSILLTAGLAGLILLTSLFGLAKQRNNH